MAHFCKKLQADCRRGWMLALTAMLIVFAPAAFAQSAPTVTGTVTDQSGQPVIGATIIEQGTTNGATTGVDGSYSLKLRGGGNSANLIFQSLGFVSQTVAVNGRTKIDVKLAEDAVALDAVVAIGYGTVKQKDLTTAVSVVKTDDLARRPITSASGALQGKAAGVQVIQPNGSPGQGMVVRVRGASSISSSNDPLYVVDGVPVGEGNYAIAYLSPNEIESMQVLKDASSAAIYGSRAANGVVLITTKQGSRKRGPEISFSTFVGISKVTKSYDVLNARQYRDLMEENGAVSGLPADLTDRTDWFDETYSTGVNQNYQFSVSNGDENSSYYLGGGYTNEKGIINTTSSDRYNVKASFDKKIFKWVSANASTTFSHYTTKGTIISGQGANRAGVVVSAITTPTYAPIWDPENPQQFYNNFYGANLTSPRENMARTDYNQDVTDRLLLSGGLTFYLAKDLTFKSTVSMDRRWVHSSSFLDPIRTSYGRTQHGTASDTRSDDMRMIYDNILTWNKSFDRHSLEVMAGTSATTSVWEQLSGSRSYFSSTNNNAIPNLNGGNNGGVRGQSYGKSEWSIMSYLARVSYNYDSKYLVTANFRADGSSKLAPGHRWGYFPSVSGAWRISEEPFMQDVKHIIDGLKLRASYGTLGNQNLAGGDAASYYPTTQNLAMGQISMNDNIYSLVTLNTLANPDIKWETTTMLDVGVDFSLFNKLNITADWYRKETKDILMKLDMPLGIGLNAPYQNAGKVRNTGWEVSVGYNNQWRDFSFGVQANLSDVKNEILDMRGKTSTSGVLRNQEGYSIGSIYALKSLGIIRTQEEADWVNANCPQFKETVQIGDIRYVDIDGNNSIDENDKDIVGSTIPRYTYSLNLNFGWKGLRLGLLFQGVGKTDGYLNTYYVMPSNQGGTFRKEHLDWASAENPNGKTPRLTSANKNNWYDSSFWMKSAAYLRLKNIQLGYELPKSWMHRIGLNSAYLYANAQNLFTVTNFWDGYDPEVGYGGDSSGDFDVVKLGSANNYPQVKIVTVGLELKF